MNLPDRFNLRIRVPSPRIFLTSTAVLSFLVLLPAADFGLFDSRHDIGTANTPGVAQWLPQSNQYRVSGSGTNIWNGRDGFQFVYTQVSGDISFSADVRFEGKGHDPQRKAALMIRQTLEPDSQFASVTLQGDGATALQYRPGQGVQAEEVRAAIKGAVQLRIERHGHEFDIWAGQPGEQMIWAGPIVVTMQDPVYIGLAVCSHNPDVLETAIFSRVQLQSKRGRSSR